MMKLPDLFLRKNKAKVKLTFTYTTTSEVWWSFLTSSN